MKRRETHEIRPLLTSLLLVYCLLLTGCRMQAQPVKNGFDLSDSLVPPSEIKGGGPPKDGIPAISDPEMTSVQEAMYLDGSDQVIGVVNNGDARAYPLKILVHHENVNDVVGNVPVAVTY